MGMQRNHQRLSQSPLASDWVGATKTHEYVIRCVLHTASGSMELPGCLGGNLAKEIAIGKVCHRAENQIRSHKNLRKI
jgi:hypothetical protein